MGDSASTMYSNICGGNDDTDLENEMKSEQSSSVPLPYYATAQCIII